MDKPNSWQIAIAAEAIAAGCFARCGYDVSVQYGANQPEYDFIIAKHQRLLKVSAKGSQDGSWGLTQSYMEKGDYHKAIDKWLEKHHGKTIFCFVQFKNVKIDELPRIYLATPREVAQRLRETAKGRGETILYEYKEWTSRAYGTGTIDKIPEEWRFSKQRIEELFDIT